MREVGNVIKKHTDMAFGAEGYSSNGIVSWKKKKRDDGFKVLHKTGRLRSSTYVSRMVWPTVIVKNNTPYGDYHNQGGRQVIGKKTGRLPQRHFMDDRPGKSPALDKKIRLVLDKYVKRILK